jgi:hypothetical protein
MEPHDCRERPKGGLMKLEHLMHSSVVGLTILLAASASAFGTDAARQEDAKQDKSSPVYQSPSKRWVRLGGITVGASYMRGNPYYGPYGYFGPFWEGPYWSSIYSPYWYSPWIHSGLYNGFSYGPGMGELKLPTKSKSAAVYIDGAFAGSADKLKHFWLEPGAYNIEVKDAGRTAIKERVYVLSGKTILLHAGERE